MISSIDVIFFVKKENYIKLREIKKICILYIRIYFKKCSNCIGIESYFKHVYVHRKEKWHVRVSHSLISLRSIFFSQILVDSFGVAIHDTVKSSRRVRSFAKLSRDSCLLGVDVSTRVTKIDDAITRVITAKNQGAETPMTFVFVVNVGKPRVFLATVSHAAHAILRTHRNARERTRERRRATDMHA